MEDAEGRAFVDWLVSKGRKVTTAGVYLSRVSRLLRKSSDEPETPIEELIAAEAPSTAAQTRSAWAFYRDFKKAGGISLGARAVAPVEVVEAPYTAEFAWAVQRWLVTRPGDALIVRWRDIAPDVAAPEVLRALLKWGGWTENEVLDQRVVVDEPRKSLPLDVRRFAATCEARGWNALGESEAFVKKK